jgi:hypothetical protein
MTEQEEKMTMTTTHGQFSYPGFTNELPRADYPYFPGNFPGNSGTTGSGSLPSCWGGWYPQGSWNMNLPDAQVGGNDLFRCPWFNNSTRGYGLDLDFNGSYDRGTDGVLSFDFNNDGRLDKNEIQKSNNMLKAMGGDYDLNGDGKVGWSERMRGEQLRQQGQKFDTNHDGILDAGELNRAGAKVGVDKNKDGRFSADETHSIYNFPTPWFGRGSLDYVVPGYNMSHVSYNNPWSPPCPWPPTPQPRPEPPIGIDPQPPIGVWPPIGIDPQPPIGVWPPIGIDPQPPIGVWPDPMPIAYQPQRQAI